MWKLNSRLDDLPQCQPSFIQHKSRYRYELTRAVLNDCVRKIRLVTPAYLPNSSPWSTLFPILWDSWNISLVILIFKNLLGKIASRQIRIRSNPLDTDTDLRLLVHRCWMIFLEGFKPNTSMKRSLYSHHSKKDRGKETILAHQDHLVLNRRYEIICITRWVCFYMIPALFTHWALYMGKFSSHRLRCEKDNRSVFPEAENGSCGAYPAFLKAAGMGRRSYEQWRRSDVHQSTLSTRVQ